MLTKPRPPSLRGRCTTSAAGALWLNLGGSARLNITLHCLFLSIIANRISAQTSSRTIQKTLTASFHLPVFCLCACDYLKPCLVIFFFGAKRDLLQCFRTLHLPEINLAPTFCFCVIRLASYCTIYSVWVCLSERIYHDTPFKDV